MSFFWFFLGFSARSQNSVPLSPSDEAVLQQAFTFGIVAMVLLLFVALLLGLFVYLDSMSSK